MTTDNKFNRETLELFLWWIEERYQIFLKKRKKQPRPWTDDKILQTMSFCNVNRERDRTTEWFRINVRDPLKNTHLIVFATILFRQFNLITTGELFKYVGDTDSNYGELGLFKEWNLKKALEVLDTAKSRGENLFNSAYVIATDGKKCDSKSTYVCVHHIEPAWQDKHTLYSRIYTCGTLEAAHRELSKLPGFGGTGFTAAQIVADLKYTNVLHEDKVSDWWTWSCPGPGSLRGMQRLLGETDVKEKKKIKQWDSLINSLRVIINEKSIIPPIHAQDVQNCLCEFDKYVRLLTGVRATLRYYKG